MLKCCCFVVVCCYCCAVSFFCLHLLVSCDSNLGLYLVHSSNGKSVSWSESGARHPPKGGNVWHKLSVHVKKQEAGLNQTAVIRPLTNTPDPHSSEPSNENLGTEAQQPQEPPCSKPLCNMAEEDDEGDLQRPLWTPSQQTQGIDSDLDEPAFFLPSNLKCPNPEPTQRAVVNTRSSHVPRQNDHIARKPLPASKPLSLIPSQRPSASQVGAFEEESGDEELDLLHSYIHDANEERAGGNGEDEELVQHKSTLEDSLPLSPPSPFRDSVCSGDSNDSAIIESMLGSSVYASNLLQNFAHSSSTL